MASSLGQTSEAINDAQTAIELNPYQRNAYPPLWWAAENRNDWNTPFVALNRLVEQNQKEPEFLKLRAEANRVNGYGKRQKAPDEALAAYDEAIIDLTRAIGLDPTDVDALYRRAAVRAERVELSSMATDWTQAIIDMTRMLQLDPIDLAFHYSVRAKYYEALNQIPEAIMDLTKAIGIEGDARSYYQRGELYEKMGEYAKADQDYSQALADKNCAGYIKSSIYETRIKKALDQRDWNQAIQLLGRWFLEQRRGGKLSDQSIVRTAMELVKQHGGEDGEFQLAKQIVEKSSQPELVFHALAGMDDYFTFIAKDARAKDERGYSTLLNRVLQLGPLTTSQIVLLAESLAKLGEYDIAIRELEKRIDQQSTKKQLKEARARLYWSRASDFRLFSRGAEAAISDYTMAIADSPTNPSLYLGRASRYLEVGKFDLALQDADVTMKLREGERNQLWQIHSLRSNIHLKIGNLDAALADLTKAIELEASGSQPQLLMQRANVFSQRKEYERALQDFDSVIKVEANCHVHLQKGLIYKEMGDIPGALREWDQVTTSATCDGYLKLQVLGWALSLAEREDEAAAIQVLNNFAAANQEYLQTNAGYADLSYAIGNWIEELKKEKGARAAFELGWQIIQASRSNIARAMLIGDIIDVGWGLPDSERQLKINQLIQGFYVDMDKLPARALEDVGRAYKLVNNWGQAIVCYTKAISIQPSKGALYSNRAGCYGEIGYYKEAATDYSKAIELISSTENAKDIADLYKKCADALLTMKDFEGAVVSYSDAINLKPGDKSYHWSRANAYRGLGDYAKAAEDMDRVTKIDPKDENAKKTVAELQQLVTEKR